MKVHVLAPYGEDESVLSEALSGRDVAFDNIEDAGDLPADFDEETGALILTQEALTKDNLDALHTRLERQESWSEVPVLVLIDDRLQSLAMRDELIRLLPRTKMVLLSRPIRLVELQSVLDTTLRSRKRQIAVSEHLDFQRTLQRELNHRVKNVIATVQGIYAITARKAPDFETFKEDFSGRLRALGGVHDILYKVGAPEPELAAIIDNAAAPFDIGEARFESAGDPVRLEGDAATMFALAVHELFTNAIKYGALAGHEGRIALTWSIEAGGEFLRLEWIESGGPPVEAPERDGYGTKFLKSVFERNFEGSVDLDHAPQGLKATMKAKLDAITT